MVVGVAAQVDDGALLDLAGLALTAEDAAAAGLGAGFQPVEGTPQDVAAAAEAAATGRGGATPDNVASMAEFLDAVGYRQGYYADLVAPREDDPSLTGLSIRSSFDEYADAAGAAAGFAFFADVEALTGVEAEEVEGTGTIGDDSQLVRYEGEDAATGQPWIGLGLDFRSGNLAASVIVFDWTGGEPDAGTVEALAEVLLARVEAARTGGGTTGGTAGTDEPAVEERPRGGVNGNRYTSPTYGFTLIWDDSWAVRTESSEGGVDALDLSNEASVVRFSTSKEYRGNLPLCSALTTSAVADGLGDVAISPATDAEGQVVAGGDDRRAWIVNIFTLTDEDGEERQLAARTKCRILEPGEADLTIVQLVSFDAYQAQFNVFANLLAALALPGDPGEVALPLSGEHIERGEAHPPYNSSPPTSGPHIGAEVAPWGVHGAPIEDEVQVHNLEHGGVMLQYACTCPEAVALLEAVADPATGYPNLLIAAPYPEMEAEVALTAWGRIWTMEAEELTEERVRAFVEAYVNQGPEQIPGETAILEEWRAGQ
ncbi:MAG: DUF3105 domain-containing protein [Chloroflexota bacterium]|nr:DUF3105 domain-containing protein [Chloroflexota bacterium]